MLNQLVRKRRYDNLHEKLSTMYEQTSKENIIVKVGTGLFCFYNYIIYYIINLYNIQIKLPHFLEMI